MAEKDSVDTKVSGSKDIRLLKLSAFVVEKRDHANLSEDRKHNSFHTILTLKVSIY